MSEFLNRQSPNPEALYHTQLAVEEMGTNIIKYGYDDPLEHRITLRVECLAGCFRLRILDDGHPFDVRQVPEADPAQDLDERKPGGWGISLVRRLARRIDYERRDGLNVLTIEIARNS
jgi:anti-sigma regulatory factor (Ser/Thr protein kinase)